MPAECLLGTQSHFIQNFPSVKDHRGGDYEHIYEEEIVCDAMNTEASVSEHLRQGEHPLS